MESKENLVLNGTENVDVATEETTEQGATPEKTYTEAEFNAKLDEVLGKKLARREAKVRKEYDRKYGDLENVLKAGTGKESVEDMADTFREFYTKKGIEVPKRTADARDIEVLAQADVNEIISDGYEEVLNEANRLNEKGADRMTEREKAVFVALTNHIKNTETSQKLAEIGVTEDVYNSKEFKDFASKFNSSVPVEEIYNIYNQMKPKKEISTMGSMKNNTSDNGTVKDFYTRDEALQFTKADFDNNPALYKAVEASMQKW